MKAEELTEKVDLIIQHGPDRVLINYEGEAVPPTKTELKYDIIFIRNDGWSLGAPMQFANDALRLYNTWVAFMIRPTYCPRPMRRYQELTALFKERNNQ